MKNLTRVSLRDLDESDYYVDYGYDDGGNDEPEIYSLININALKHMYFD